ncbi:MAG: hypothetical protein P8Z68_06295 [Kineosporiaceae bacterium]
MADLAAGDDGADTIGAGNVVVGAAGVDIGGKPGENQTVTSDIIREYHHLCAASGDIPPEPAHRTHGV